MSRTCKFYKQQRQVSYDGGITWSNLEEYQRGDLYERDSTDCGGGGTQYRWVNIPISQDYECVGTAKYYKMKRQQSTDGINWTDVVPLETQRGSMYEQQSVDCGYVPPVTNNKWEGTYIDGTSNSKACNSSSILSSSEVTNKLNLKTIQIGGCVSEIANYVFEGVTALTAVTLAENLVKIGFGVFSGCTNLASVNIPNSVTTIMPNAFQNCSSLGSIRVPSSVSEVPNSFVRSCTSLTSITLSEGITTIGSDAFQDCDALTAITLPSTVTYIDTAAFYGCGALDHITILATTPPSLYNDSPFYYTNNCPIYVPSGSVNAYKTADIWNTSTLANRIQAIP